MGNYNMNKGMLNANISPPITRATILELSMTLGARLPLLSTDLAKVQEQRQQEDQQLRDTIYNVREVASAGFLIQVWIRRTNEILSEGVLTCFQENLQYLIRGTNTLAEQTSQIRSSPRWYNLAGRYKRTRAEEGLMSNGKDMVKAAESLRKLIEALMR